MYLQIIDYKKLVHSKSSTTMLRVQFPPGCKPVTSHVEEHELEKRLQVLSNKLINWETSDPKYYEIYVPLAYHLASEDLFLTNPNIIIQHYVSICHCNILRAFSPTSPFSQTPHILLRVLHFLIDHLKPLKATSSPFYNNAEMILTNLCQSNAFVLCSNFSEPSSTHKIIQRLLIILFDIIDSKPEENITRLIYFLLTKLLNSPQRILESILPFIFLNLASTTRKNAQNFSKKLLSNSKEILQPLLAQNFLKILINFPNSNILSSVNSIISATSSIYPDLQDHILPQLQTLLSSLDDSIKSNTITILLEVLQGEYWKLDYWKLFLAMCLHKDEDIRIMCTKGIEFFLLDTTTRQEIIKFLKLIQRDSSAKVRMQAIQTIISAAKKDLELLGDQDLLNMFKERSADKEYEVRRHTLKELSLIFYSNEPPEPNNHRTADILRFAKSFIMNEVLCGYYIKDERDRIHVEKILYTWFLNCHVEAEEKMRQLYHLFNRLNDNASKAFAELQIHRYTMRKCLIELFESRALRANADETRVRELERWGQKQLKILSKFFKDPDEAEVNLQKFSKAIEEDTSLAKNMETVLQPDITYKQSGEVIYTILNSTRDLDRTDSYYKTVKTLLERSCLMLIDEDAILALIKHIQTGLKHNREIMEDIDGDPKTTAENGLTLLTILSFVSGFCFTHPSIFRALVSFLTIKSPLITVKVLDVLTNMRKFIPLNQMSSTWTSLMDHCKGFIIFGTVGEAKAAVKFICSQSLDKAQSIMKDLLMRIQNCLIDPSSKELRTAIASLGYISWFGKGSDDMIYNLMKMVHSDILWPNPGTSGAEDVRFWSEKENLPLATIHSLEAMKCITRWAISRSLHESWILEIIRALTAFILQRVKRFENLKSDEKAWLRLQAGACLLKLCRFERIEQKLKPQQFYMLSELMLDDVYEVRKRFQAKLKRGLSRNCPKDCLPIDFMGFFALGGLEKDEELRESLKRGMIVQIRKMKTNLGKLTKVHELSEKEVMILENIKPESAVIYAVVILAHWRGKETHWDKELMNVKRGLEFILEYWFQGDDEEKDRMFRFFKQLLQRLRVCKGLHNSNNDRINSKIRTVCDVAMYYIESVIKKERGVLEEADNAVLQPRIPRKYLIFDDECPEESEDSLSREILMATLKDFERNEKQNKRKKVEEMKRIDMPLSIKAIFGVKRRTNRGYNSWVLESSAKRRKLTF